MKEKTDKFYDLRWTTNRSYYNKLYKEYLEYVGDIHCCYCGFNRGENSKIKYYSIDADGTVGRFPSWKLVSKNRKQWMKKPYHPEPDYDLEWSGWSGNTIPYKRIPYIDVHNPANFE